MNDYYAPQRAEAFLSSLGADESLTNDVLGDLAEEFAERVTWQGRAQARWWYYRQVVTVTPLLLRDWRRNARRADYESVAVSVLWSTLATQTLAAVLYTAIDRVTYAVTDVPFGTWMKHFVGIESPLAWIIGWSFVATLSFAGGFIASRFGKRAPIPTLLAGVGSWVAMYFAIGGRNAVRPESLVGLSGFVTMALAGGLTGILTSSRSMNAPASS